MHPVRRYRAKRALTIKDLENRTGVAAGTITRIELRQRTPRPITLHRLAEGLGVDIEDLTEYPEEKVAV
jgi:transcriptional regulator with XRE-family HTH domain